MKLAVCLKQVPSHEWQPRLADDGTWIREQDVSYEMNDRMLTHSRRRSDCASDMAAR